MSERGKSAIQTLPVGPRLVVVWPRISARTTTWSYSYAVIDFAVRSWRGSLSVADAGAQQGGVAARVSDEDLREAIEGALAGRGTGQDRATPDFAAALSGDVFASLPKPTILCGDLVLDWRADRLTKPLRARLGDPENWAALDARHQTLLSGALAVLIGHLVFATHLFPMSALGCNDGLPDSAPSSAGGLAAALGEFASMLSAVRGYAEVAEVDKHLKAYDALATPSFADGAKLRKPHALERLALQEAHPLFECSDGGSGSESGVVDYAAFRAPCLGFISGPRGRESQYASPGSLGLETVLLFSGGIDSALLASRTGSDTLLLHFGSNVSSRASERRAAASVAEKVGAADRLMNVDLLFPDLVPLGRRFSRIFGRHPYFNTVPHGRDLVLLTAAAAIARNLGIGNVLLGYEGDSAAKVIAGHDEFYEQLWAPQHPLPRHDFEHAGWHKKLLDYLNADVPDAYVLRDADMMYQVGDMYAVRRALVGADSDVYSETSSCFWGSRCERCIKCVAEYALLRRFQYAPDDTPEGAALSERAGRYIAAMGMASDPLEDPNAQEIVDLMARQGAAYQAILLPALEELANVHETSGYAPYWVRTFSNYRSAGGDHDGNDSVPGKGRIVAAVPES